jgi:5-methylcytosine-specific restriction endonuclease McrA
LPDTPSISSISCTLVAVDTAYAHAMAVSRTRRVRAARKRKRRLDNVVNDLTDEQWAAIRDAWNGCAYCGATGTALQRDCVMAISRGGRYTVDNVVPACAPCNASKCNDEVTGWMRRKRLDERLFLTRYVEIRAALVPFPARTDT